MDFKKIASTGLVLFCMGAAAMMGMRVVDLIMPKREVMLMVCVKESAEETHCDDFAADPS